jgi:DNA-binding MarR family transcriptional regulator
MKELQLSTSERPLFSAEEINAESVFVATLRLANAFGASCDALFKEHGLTSAQYNTLRILRDAPPEGFSCQQISAALIQRDPDVTRLADRLEDRGFVSKARAKNDRRVVNVKITEKGVRLVNALDRPLVQGHTDELNALTLDERKQFLALLQKLLCAHDPLKSVFNP